MLPVRVVRLRPWRWLLAALLALGLLGGRDASAADLLRSRDWGEPLSGEDWFRRGWMLHQERNYRAAIDAFARAVDASYRAPISMYNIACGFAQAGQADPAFAWLERALAAGLDDPEVFTADADFRPLRNDPRWGDLEQRARAISALRRERRQAPQMVPARAVTGR